MEIQRPPRKLSPNRFRILLTGSFVSGYVTLLQYFYLRDDTLVPYELCLCVVSVTSRCYYLIGWTFQAGFWHGGSLDIYPTVL